MASSRTAFAVALLTVCAFNHPALRAQSPFDLAGTWTLNRQLSQFPQEVGFNANLPPDAAGSAQDDGGGRRRGEGGGRGRAPRLQNQSAEDAQRVRYLTDEVRLPYDRLTIEVTPAMVTIAPDRASVRTIHPGRRDEEVSLGPVTALTNASWDTSRLVIVFKAETGRLLRYTYAIEPAARQLIVDVEFVERGGDKVRRIYEPSTPGAPAAGPTTPLPGVSTSSAASPAAPAPASSRPAFPPAAPGLALPGSSASLPPSGVDQRPDAALRGLARLGVVVEGPGAEAAKCGLKLDALEAAVGKRLTDAGFRVARNSDEESYLYVNVNTATSSASLCVSRYDVTLYSHTAARLAHTSSPVPLQVELLHEGGIAGGPPAAHGDGVTKSVLDDVDRMVARVRTANR